MAHAAARLTRSCSCPRFSSSAARPQAAMHSKTEGHIVDHRTVGSVVGVCPVGSACAEVKQECVERHRSHPVPVDMSYDGDMASGVSPTDVLIPEPTSKRVEKVNRARFAQGIVLLVLVNVIWVAASVLMKFIYDDLGFNQPFFITYISNSLFLVYLFLVPTWNWMKRRFSAPSSEQRTSRIQPRGAPAARKFTLKETAKVALYICPVWFAAQCTYNASLDWTSVASSTILSTVSGLFTFVISVVVLKEAYQNWKLVGVAATLGGAVLVGLSDRDSDSNGSDTLGGDALALFSAFCYAVYTTMIRKFIPDEHSVSMAMFFGFLGLFNCIALLPVVFILKAIGKETLEGLDFTLFCFICLKGLVDNVLSDWLWARAVLLTSPTIATIGLTLTIPLSMMSDWMIKGIVPSALLVSGALCVILGFVAVNLGGQYNGPEKEKPKPPPRKSSELGVLHSP